MSNSPSPDMTRECKLYFDSLSSPDHKIVYSSSTQWRGLVMIRCATCDLNIADVYAAAARPEANLGWVQRRWNDHVQNAKHADHVGHIGEFVRARSSVEVIVAYAGNKRIRPLISGSKHWGKDYPYWLVIWISTSSKAKKVRYYVKTAHRYRSQAEARASTYIEAASGTEWDKTFVDSSVSSATGSLLGAITAALASGSITQVQNAEAELDGLLALFPVLHQKKQEVREWKRRLVDG